MNQYVGDAGMAFGYGVVVLALVMFIQAIGRREAEPRPNPGAGKAAAD